MSQYSTMVHGLKCDICQNDSIEDCGENQYSKKMRAWAKEAGWGRHNGKDYCLECESEYRKNRKQSQNEYLEKENLCYE